LLVEQYGIPRLGNYLDPIREIFYILLSAKTSDSQYRRTFQRLYTTFASLSAMAAADVKQILPCIASGGLANKKARQIKRTAAALAALGDDPASRLREMDDERLFEFLTRLPGMGPKSAFCVMMYSLRVDVFPVDVNVQRIAERMGAIPKGLKHYQAQQRLPGLIPPNRSRELHITMVAHGREVCLPRNPKCSGCRLRDMCKRGRASAEADGE
jgi:endonuclease III